MVNLRAVIAGQDQASIRREMTALNHATETFAARRMDVSVQRAFTGHRLDELQ
jgi:molecular chaperone HscA